MTKLLDGIDLKYIGKRHAEMGPLPVEVLTNTVVREFANPAFQEELRAEIRISAVGVVPTNRNGVEYARVSEHLSRMIAQEIYGEIVDDLQALLAHVGRLQPGEIRERLHYIIDKMEPK